jgi:hypothetical protein
MIMKREILNYEKKENNKRNNIIMKKGKIYIYCCALDDG